VFMHTYHSSAVPAVEAKVEISRSREVYDVDRTSTFIVGKDLVFLGKYHLFSCLSLCSKKYRSAAFTKYTMSIGQLRSCSGGRRDIVAVSLDYTERLGSIPTR
jgi:hypothetical protein